jgi:phage portal protein BeeE
MATLLQRFAQRSNWPAVSVDEAFQQIVSYAQNAYALPSGSLQQGHEEVTPDFPGLIAGAYKSNGVVFACMLVRMMLFSETRFQFRQVRNGRPGNLFGNKDLQILETPWTNGTTGDLLTRTIQDADLEGNFYAYRDGDQIRRMRPDWTTIVMGSKMSPKTPGIALDAEIIGYAYHPGGRAGREKPIALLAEEVAHFAPVPDPSARFRGMSWLTPVVREIMADGAATTHKLNFFENGATPNLVVRLDPSIELEQWDEWVDAFTEGHEGVANAYKTIYLGGGADVTVVGGNMRQIDFKATQGAGETRITAASGVPAVIVGMSEGLQSATYSNFDQAMRKLGDVTMRPLWRQMCASFAPIITVPGGSELWYDARDVAFLQQSAKDAADIMQLHATTIKALVDSGYESSSVIDAVTSGDFSRLLHTGLFSVQLQPPLSGEAAPKLGAPVPAELVPTGEKPAKPTAPAPPAKASLTVLPPNVRALLDAIPARR